MTDRVLDLLERYPLEIAIILAAGLVGFLVMLRLFRIRMGFPAILFASLLLILAGVSCTTYLQLLSKGVFRWIALAAVALMALFYLPRATLPLNRATPVHWGWIAFLLLATATAPLSGHPTFALLNCVAVGTLFVAAFGSVWFFTSDGRSVVSLIEVVHRLAILVLILGFLFAPLPKAASEEPAEEGSGGRFQGFFNNPNWNGNFSAMVLPVLLWKRRYPRSRFEKRITTAAVAVCAVNIVLSGSRGAILAGFPAAMLAQWRLDKREVTRNLVLMVPLVLLILLSEVGRQYIGTHADRLARLDKAATLTHRTEMWEQAWPSIKQHWLIGDGLGNSRFILLEGSGQKEAEQIGGTGATLHSQFVVMLAETGVVGLLLLVIFIFFMCSKGVGLWHVPRTPFSDLSFVLVCSCLLVFGDAVLHGWMTSAGSPYALLFWSLVALCLKSERLARAQTSAGSRGVGGHNAARIPWSPPAANERMVR